MSILDIVGKSHFAEFLMSILNIVNNHNIQIPLTSNIETKKSPTSFIETEPSDSLQPTSVRLVKYKIIHITTLPRLTILTINSTVHQNIYNYSCNAQLKLQELCANYV